MWVYRSPIGPIYILQSGGRFVISHDGEKYGSYHSAVAAADDVYTFSTGCSEWDLLCGTVEPPTSIYEWEKG